MLKFIIVLASLVAVIHSQTYGLGACPNVNVIKDYDISKMSGIWYTNQRFSSYLDSAKCVSHNLIDIGLGHLLSTVSTTSSNVKTTALGVNVYVGKMLPNGPSQFLAVFPTSQVPAPLPYSLINTDYTSYAVAYSCIDLGFANIKGVWIYTREKIPTSSTLNKAYSDLDGAGIDRTMLHIVDQTC